MENIVMFTFGAIIFALYLVGYVIMINKAHKFQQTDMENDPELKAHYRKTDLNRVLSTLVHLAESDGHISEEEQKMIIRIGKENGLNPDQVEALIKDPKPLEAMSDLPREAKLELIIDVIRLMKIDNKINQQEIKFCESIAVKLGYRAEVVKDLSTYISTSVDVNSDKSLLKEMINKFYNS
jgi:uncharacterized membrane protein YebE (DUF533 family)